ncbi:hypothetical protein GO499_06380 [Algicella marina]|uniref:Lipoprotein n=2 Tax=Algicella marina TaxID=2683284 RepID=A0A6P1T2X4_9RHOB|nr:hypothetical protein GO499_06380 [Algicella marina]
MRAVITGSILLALAACGNGSGSNPLGSLGSNPFSRGGNPDPVVVSAEGRTIVPEGSILVPAPVEVRPEAALRGMILRATATAPTQGYYGAVLIPERRGAPDEDGIVTYQFRVFPPVEDSPTGPVRTRQLTAAAFVPDKAIAGVSGFRIVSQTGGVSIGR